MPVWLQHWWSGHNPKGVSKAVSETDKQETESKGASVKPAEQDDKGKDKKPQPASQDKARKTPLESKPVRPPRQRAGYFALLIALLAIALIAGAGWYGFHWHKQTREQLSVLQQGQIQLSAQNEQLAQQSANRVAVMQASQKELAGYVEALRQKDQHLRKDWLVMEAEYLIQLANHRLLFERDINTAIVALQSADVRIKEAGDPSLLNTRKAIASAVQALKQVDQADLAGLSLTISAINQDLAALPLNTPDTVSKAKTANTDLAESKQVQSWSELPAAIWRDLKTLIVIRDHNEPVAPLLSPDQRFFLVENLRLQLEQARLAMLAGQSSVYKERLQTAILWIEKHFDKEAALTQSTLDTLRQMSNAAIAPALPDISPAYGALQNYRDKTEAGKGKPTEVKPSMDVNGTN